MINIKRSCSSCGRIYPATEQYFTYGRTCINNISHVCKKCSNSQKKLWQKRTGKNASYYTKLTPKEIKNIDLWRASVTLRRGILKRRRKVDCFVDEMLTREYIYTILLKMRRCECCNKELDFSIKKYVNDNSPTIDKIIPKLGYRLTNIAILCHRCNKLKGSASLQELEMILRWLRNAL